MGAIFKNDVLYAGGGAESGMRYDSDTDKIQLYDKSTDTWVDWLSGGLQTLDLLTLSAGDWTTTGSKTTTNLTVSPFTLTSITPSSSGSYYSYCKTVNFYDLTGKTKLEITGTGWHVIFGGIELINAETGTTDYKYTRSASGNFDEVLQLPELKGNYYIRLNSGAYGNASSNTVVSMTVFRITK